MKNEILSLTVKRMELEDIMLNVIIQTQREKCHMVSYMWKLKKADLKVEQWLLEIDKGGGEGGGKMAGYNQHMLDTCIEKSTWPH
jgi:hypothetical protein